MKTAFIPLMALVLASPARAEDARILDVGVEQQGMAWRVNVTLRHPDTGWDHYADGWEVLDSDGARLGYRELHHPHVDEQPFTRSLANVMIPDGTRQVFVRTSCSVDGWSDDVTPVELSY